MTDEPGPVVEERAGDPGHLRVDRWQRQDGISLDRHPGAFNCKFRSMSDDLTAKPISRIGDLLYLQPESVERNIAI